MMSHCIGHAEGYRSIPTQPTTPDGGWGMHMRECVLAKLIGIGLTSSCCVRHGVQFLRVELGLQSCHSLAVSWLSATGNWSFLLHRLAVYIVVDPGPTTPSSDPPKFLAAASTLCRSGRLGRAQPKGSTSQIIHLILCHPCDMICEAPPVVWLRCCFGVCQVRPLASSLVCRLWPPETANLPPVTAVSRRDRSCCCPSHY